MTNWWPSFDRRRHWLDIGCSEEEVTAKLKSSTLGLAGVLVVASIGFGIAFRVYSDYEDEIFEFSKSRTALSACVGTVALLAWCMDTYGMPPAPYGSDPERVMSTIGPVAYFTKQSLSLCLVHAWLSFYAEFASSPPVAILVHKSACSIAATQLALALLFLKLNWFEAAWRGEILDPWFRRGVYMHTITLFAHLANAPMYLLDVSLVKRSAMLGPTYDDAAWSCIFLASYVTFYVSLTLVNFKLCGAYPYPFMRSFTTYRHWLLFALVILAFLFFFVLPLVFLARSFNDDSLLQ